MNRTKLFAMTSFIISLFFVLLIGFWAYGCKDASGFSGVWITTPDPTRMIIHTPNGRQVGVPNQLWLKQKTIIDQVLALVDETGAQEDVRVPQIVETLHVGPPAGWVVQVHQSGWFPTPASPTGFASGLTDSPSRTVHVALSQSSGTNGPWLPALAHEYSHAWAYALGLGENTFQCINHACALQ